VANPVLPATCCLFFSLCPLFRTPSLCFQSLAASFRKTPGVGICLYGTLQLLLGLFA
jgi:hypothetical protein